ncbi:MAG: KH domain-containing protein [Bacillota bacterium]|nr:KH domain-containing protein [Bacillota bacterium]
MIEVLKVIVNALVDHPDQVRIDQLEDDDRIVIELRVAPSDMGKVIGKQGRIAKAIRTVVKAASGNTDKRVFVEIVD